MEKDKISELLEYRFNLVSEYPKKRHIIFWYDSQSNFKEIVESLELSNAKVIILKKEQNRKGEIIDTNIFFTKYTLECLDTESNFLIYSPFPRPSDRENFLIDIEKYSEFFEADKSAMIVEELKLDRTNYSIIQCVKEHLDFFGSKERREKLSKILERPESLSERELRLGILAVISGAKSFDILEILKALLLNPEKLSLIEKWLDDKFLYEEIKEKFNLEVDNFDIFLRVLLVVYFYRELQIKPHINLEKYYLGKSNEIYIFISSLLQNKITEDKIKEMFNTLGDEIGIFDRIKELNPEELVQGTAFEIYDKIIIKYIAENLYSETQNYDKYQKIIKIRIDTTLWQEKYLDYYNLLLVLTDILKFKDVLIIKDRTNMKDVYEDYTNSYYIIDTLYRKFFFYYDKVKTKESFDILDELKDRVSYFYEKDYLDRLLSVWSDVLSLNTSLPYQKDFYKNYIENSDTRVAVIVSDALRFEIGEEICERLKKEATAKEIILKSMLTDLPSITSVGMTNLLPDIERVNNPLTKTFSIKGINTATTENRDRILKIKNKDSSAIQFKNFKNLNRAEQEEYIKGKKVIYIYHDMIDSIGDEGKSEHQTFEACNMAIEDIIALSKNLSSLGVVNIYITSDHGFLCERKDIEEYNKLELNKIQNNYEVIGKRYALSKVDVEERGCVTLNLNGYFGVFPEKKQRIKTSGSGLQFVHGGISPQEMIVPLIQYKSGANSKKASKVKVRIKESTGKITSNLTKFSVYQLDGINSKNKIIERDILVALYDGDIRVSNEVKIRLNSPEENYQHDFRLTLSGEYHKVTLKVMDIESGDILDSKEYEVKIGIISAFDF